VGLEDTDPGKLDVLAISQHLDRARGEPAGIAGAPFLLEAWEAHSVTLAAAVSRVAPVLQRSGQPVQAGGVGLLGVLGPPRCNLVLGPVPLPTQLGKRPRHSDARIGLVLVQADLDQGKTPVVGDPGGSAVRGKRTALGWCGVEREPVGLGHDGHGHALWLVSHRSMRQRYEPAMTAADPDPQPTSWCSITIGARLLADDVRRSHHDRVRTPPRTASNQTWSADSL
jgi:hypothetical protein